MSPAPAIAYSPELELNAAWPDFSVSATPLSSSNLPSGVAAKQSTVMRDGTRILSFKEPRRVRNRGFVIAFGRTTPAISSRDLSLALIGQRIRPNLEVNDLTGCSFSSLTVEWRPGAPRRPDSLAFPASLRVVDAAVHP